jgi:hypothetical protein
MPLFRIFLTLCVVCLLPACAGGFSYGVSFHSTLPVRPAIDPYLPPVPRKAWEVMPPGARVVDNWCSASDATETWVNGKITRSSFGRNCTVTFVTRQGQVCTTSASESQYDSYGRDVSKRKASKPKCRTLKPEEKERWGVR